MNRQYATRQQGLGKMSGDEQTVKCLENRYFAKPRTVVRNAARFKERRGGGLNKWERKCP